MAELDSWLENRSAAPYLLLATHAGRGKSALLVRWTRRLLERQNIAVVFFPVSVRFRTNLASVVFASLVARLASLHLERLPYDLNTPPEVWREALLRYLSRSLHDRRSLLIILDGIDEAADWDVGPDLFPLTPVEGLRLVLSARLLQDRDARGWLSQLGWADLSLAEVQDLRLLRPDGVAAILRSAGPPLNRLATEEDSRTLHRISEGDALVVSLYIKDLRKELDQKGLEAARTWLAAREGGPTGLEGYFDIWWKDQRALWGDQATQRERESRVVLDLLSCAHGPLSLEDMRHVAPPQAGLTSTHAVEATLKHVDRFIVGEGRREGCGFSHPGLAFYFHDKLSIQEQREWHQRFVNYGLETIERLNTGRSTATEASPYLVQYLGRHMEGGRGPVVNLLLLLSDGWRRAWESVEGGYGGFLSDVNRAWRAAEHLNQAAADAGQILPHLGSEVRCALIQSSARTVGSIPPSLMAALVQGEVWSPAQGLAYCRQITDPSSRMHALLALMSEATSGTRVSLLEEARQTALCIEEGKDRASALTELASRLPAELRGEYLSAALQAVQGIKYESDRAAALIGLLPHLFGPQLPMALSIAAAINAPTTRADALITLVPHVSGEMREKALLTALQSVEALEIGRERARALTRLSRSLSSELTGIALEVVSKAMTGLWGDISHTEAISSLSPYLPEELRSRVVRETLESALRIIEPHHRMQALANLVPHLVDELRCRAVSGAVDASLAIEDQAERAEDLKRLALGLPTELRDEYLSEALNAVRRIRDEPDRAKALIGLVPHLPEALHPTVLNIAVEIRAETARAEALVCLVPYASRELRSETLQAALEAVQAIEPGYARATALTKLSRHTPVDLKDRMLRRALDDVRGMKEQTARVNALIELLPYLSEDIRGEAIQAALQTVQSIKHEGARALMLTRLAPHLPVELTGATLRGVLTIMQGLGSDMDLIARDLAGRIEAIISLVPRLPPEFQYEFLNSGLGAIRAIKEESDRARALIGLASHLSGDLFATALDLARSFAKKTTRLEALVQIAPHLPGGLRGEALRAALDTVRLVGDGKYRAIALTKLAPHLPAPLLGSIFKIAKEVQENASRAIALTQLVPHLPQELRDEALPVAIEAAQGIKEEKHRVKAVVELAPHLSEPLLAAALDGIRHIGRQDARADLLIGLAPYLPEKILRKALQAVEEIQDENLRALTLAGIAPHLPSRKCQAMRKALLATRTIEYGYVRAQAISYLAPHLGEALLPAALQAIQGIEEEDARAKALASLAKHLPEPLLHQAFKAVCEISRGNSRTIALIAFVPHLPSSLKEEVLSSAIDTVKEFRGQEAQPQRKPIAVEQTVDPEVRAILLGRLASDEPSSRGEYLIRASIAAIAAISSSSAKASALASLLDQFADLSIKDLYPIWRQVLRLMAQCHRADLLSQLPRLIPTLSRLGGTEAVIEAARAIEEAGQWWP